MRAGVTGEQGIGGTFRDAVLPAGSPDAGGEFSAVRPCREVVVAKARLRLRGQVREVLTNKAQVGGT